MRGLANRLQQRLGNPLEWTWTDKGLLCLGMTVAFTPLLLLTLYLVAGFDTFSELGGGSFQVLFLAVFCLLFVLGVAVRKTQPRALWVVYPAIAAIAIHSAWFVSRAGYATNPITYLMLFVDVFVALLLFDYRAGATVLACWIAVIAAHMGLERVGMLPYASFVVSLDPEVARAGGLWDMAQMLNGFVVAMVCLGLCGYMIHRWRLREQQVVEMSDLLKKMFGRYLSIEVMNSLMENPAALELGGERRTVTILMSDLRGFTPLSERLEPEQVVQLLNTYFEVMVEIILAYNGTISEIIGDALLVVFGAPQDLEDGTLRAVACALEMQNAMAEVNRQNKALAGPEIEMGIGVNEAEVVVGNIGSSKRSNYTVVGRGVNMVQRIESCSVGGQVLISETVRRSAGDALLTQGRREIFPKGADSPLIIYEVLGVGQPYNITLDRGDTPVVGLHKAMAVTFVVLDGKQVGRDIQAGELVGLSPKAAGLAAHHAPPPMSNLKLNLVGVGAELGSRAFYAKVIGATEQGGDTHLIRFTSLPPEVDGAFRAAILQSRE